VSKIVSVHSFRGGTGKSNTTANVAALLAARGKRIGVVDTDIQSPGIHILFGLAGDRIQASLNDYLWHGRAIEDTAVDVTPVGAAGAVYLIPASTKPGEITRALREGYDAKRLTQGFRNLIDMLQFDVLLIDTHPGLNEETLLSLVIAHLVIVVMRPDNQDYEGTGIAVKVARGLNVPNLLIVVNKSPLILDPRALKDRVHETYGCEVAAVLPHSDEMLNLASSGIFAVQYPNHAVTDQYRAVANRVDAL
jgi:MinD-like ATPase involved in chromosome partitioning or flagellar assembly